MSWSAYATGKPAKVRETIETAFGGSICAEPEETIRIAAKEVILAALAGQREDSVVQVQAGGSMSQTHHPDTAKWGPPVTNNLEIKVTHLCVID